MIIDDGLLSYSTTDKWEIQRAEIVIGEELGAGQFGVSTWKETQKQIIKTVSSKHCFAYILFLYLL